jgi:hypothetical protein
MLRLMTEMMKLPVTLFVSGMEVFVRAMREFQHIANRTLDTSMEQMRSDAEWPADRGTEAAQLPNDGSGCASEKCMTAPHDPQPKESDAMMDERALGSEDTKTVRYRIIFTKRNHETTLKEDEATVNYATDPMSISGRYISDFWAAAAIGEERDALKRLFKAGYNEAVRTRVAPGKSKKITKDMAEDEKKFPKLGWTITDEDKKYIAFRVDLLDQLPRQKGEYDREKADELRKIREILDDRLKKSP